MNIASRRHESVSLGLEFIKRLKGQEHAPRCNKKSLYSQSHFCHQKNVIVLGIGMYKGLSRRVYKV